MASRGPSFLGTLFVILFAMVVLGGIALQVVKPGGGPANEALGQPESALRAYLKAAEDFTFDRCTFEDVRAVVPQEDWDWFQANYERLFQNSDFFGLGKSTNPVQMGGFKRRAVLQRLLTHGPYHASDRILSANRTGDETTFVVRKMEGYEDGSRRYWDCRVRVRLEGKTWRVVDFAGGRAAAEGRAAAGDVVEVPAALAESGAPARPAAPPPPQSPGTLQDAEKLIAEASSHWNAGAFDQALASAEKALAIYRFHLGPAHQKTAEVQGMVDAARSRLTDRP